MQWQQPLRSTASRITDSRRPPVSSVMFVCVCERRRRHHAQHDAHAVVRSLASEQWEFCPARWRFQVEQRDICEKESGPLPHTHTHHGGGQRWKNFQYIVGHKKNMNDLLSMWSACERWLSTSEQCFAVLHQNDSQTSRVCCLDLLGCIAFVALALLCVQSH